MLSDFVGQTAAITQIQTAIDAAWERCTILPHTLLIAPPGVGKTRLSQEIADAMSTPLVTLTMPRPWKIVNQTLIEHTGILLLDEIHQADRKTMDALLPFLVDGTVPYGYTTMTNQYVTIIAATTDPQSLPDAFRSRFRLEPRFVDYTHEEIAEILRRRAADTRVSLPDEVALGLAKASLGNPRQGLHLLENYRDLAVLRDEVSADDVLAHVGYTRDGLRPEHLQYLRALHLQKGTASLATLAQMVFMPNSALKWVERDLLRLGMISIGGQGRELRVVDWEKGVDEVVSDETAPRSSDLNPYTLEPRS